MLPAQVQDALATLSPLAGALGALQKHWRGDAPDASASLSDAERAAADVLDRALPTLSRSTSGNADLGALFGKPAGELVFTWCAESAARPDLCGWFTTNVDRGAMPL